MLDIETLGTRPGCKILSIGAVEIVDTVNPRTFYQEISRRQDRLFEDAQTVQWWSEQPDGEHMLSWNSVSKLDIKSALVSLSKFISQYKHEQVYIWGNGSDFDNAILANTYSVYELQVPWEFKNNRCFRTIKNLFPTPSVKSIKPHNALDDAKAQAKQLNAIMKQYNLKLN